MDEIKSVNISIHTYYSHKYISRVCEGLYSFWSLFSKEEKKREERRNPYSCFVIIDHDSSMSLVNLTQSRCR